MITELFAGLSLKGIRNFRKDTNVKVLGGHASVAGHAGVLPVKELSGTMHDGGFQMRGGGASAEGEDESSCCVFAAGAVRFTDGAFVP